MPFCWFFWLSPVVFSVFFFFVAERETITFGGASVAIHVRGDGRVALRWREDGRWKTTTRLTMEDARAWAKAKARRLDTATGAQWVTPAAKEQLEWLSRIAGGAAGVPALLSHLEAARTALGGTLERLPDAARWYASQGGDAMREVTMGVAVSEFVAAYERKHPTITVRGVKSELSAFAASHPDLALADVTAELLDAHIRRGGVANRTLRNRHSYWVLFFNAAIAAHWWPRKAPAPIAGVRREKPVRKSPEIFTPEEGGALLRSVSAEAPHLLSYLLIAGWLGCRPFECQRLLWSDIDFEQSMLHVRADVARKVAAERWIPIPGALLELLRQCHGARRKLAGKRDHICRLKSQNSISEIARRHGLKWSIDVLRHSRITYRLQETHDIGRVAEESGNSPSEIRSSYKRPIPPGRWELWMAALEHARPADWHARPAMAWTAEELEMLGRVPDSAIAGKTGRPVDSVMKKRLALKRKPVGRAAR